ncbi:MAG: hypothetical protein LBS74_10280 [Oscillospiraceae bacterium]|jgi:hypothetical protein|nr:hypothetical protein [Oscillospiraceae bacterium]
MIAACITIVLIILVASFMFYRSGRKDYGKAIWPLASVPASHALFHVLSPKIASAFSVLNGQSDFINIGVDVTALIIGALLLGQTARNIESTKNRRLFMSSTTTFLIIIAWVLIADIIK